MGVSSASQLEFARCLPDIGTRTIRGTTYTAIFARFAICTRDRPLLWAAAVFCRPSETIGGCVVVSELITVRPPRRILHRRPSHLTTASVILAQAARQHQSSVRLAHPERHNFGVVHGGYHIAEQHCGQHKCKEPQTHFANREPGHDAERGQHRHI